MSHKYNLHHTRPRDENDLHFYAYSIKHFTLLGTVEEKELFRKWREEQDEVAAHKILHTHMRLVTKLAASFRGYGLPLHDLIAEGHLGMMHALKKFDPSLGNRFSTYASYWIQASLKSYVLKSWSLVKMGTGAEQKKLFFQLRRLKQKYAYNEIHLSDATIDKIAAELKVDRKQVISMDQRLQNPDSSFNVSRSTDDEREWLEGLKDEEEVHDSRIAHQQEFSKRQALIDEAMENLNQRELEVINSRRLKEPPETLEEISSRLNLSRERVRQIELAAFHKLQHDVQNRAKELNL